MQIQVLNSNDDLLPKEQSGENSVVDPQTLKFRRTFKNSKEAYDWHRSMVQDNKGRLDKQKKIAKMANDTPPTTNASQKNTAEGWQPNLCTGFYSAIKRRVKPGYKKTIDDAQYLTSSKLSTATPEDIQKNQIFRQSTTEFIRSWSGFGNFCDRIIDEMLDYGYSAEISTDPYDWKPIMARQDEVFFPSGCGQISEEIPGFSYLQKYQIHELADRLKNPEISKMAGWNVKNLVKALNKAKPDNRQETGSEDQTRAIEDLNRESAYGLTSSSGVKVVKTVHVFAVEPNGKVSHWLVLDQSGNDQLLFEQLDQFKDIFDCLNTISLEVGNGKLHGSKGIGRLLFNITQQAERIRNQTLTASFLAGQLIVQKKGKSQISNSPITIRSPFTFLDENLELLENKLSVNPEAFAYVDQFMVSLAEGIIGAFLGTISNNQDKEQKASKINYVASINQVVSADAYRRFWEHFMRTIQKIQKKVYSNDNINTAWELYQAEQKTGKEVLTKEEASELVEIGEDLAGTPVVDSEEISNFEAIVQCLKLMRKGLKKTEIRKLRNASTISVSDDAIDGKGEGIAQVQALYAGNPIVDQNALAKMNIASIIGNDLAEKLVIPGGMDTTTVVAQRDQLIELVALMAGEPIQAAEIDIHPVHMDVIMAKTKEFTEMVKGKLPEEIQAIVVNVMDHFASHLEFFKKTGAEAEEVGRYEQWLQITQQLSQEQANPAPSNGTAPASQPMPTGGLESPREPGETDAVNQQQSVSPQPIPPQDSMPLSRGQINLNPKVQQ